MTQTLEQPPSPATEQPKEPKPKSDFERLLDRDMSTPEMVAVVVDSKEFDQRFRKAKLYADSDVVPAHFRGKPANCYIAIEIAERLRVSLLMVMQNTYIVSGKLGFQGQFAIAVINASGKFAEPLEFEISADDADASPSDPSYQVRCVATRVGGKRAIKGPWVTWQMVKAEGWDKNAKWKNLPDLMFRYRAAAFFGRTVCPELLMGFQTVEELEDVGGTIDNPPHSNGNGKHKQAKEHTQEPAGTVQPRSELDDFAADVSPEQPGPGTPTPAPVVSGDERPASLDEEAAASVAKPFITEEEVAQARAGAAVAVADPSPREQSEIWVDEQITKPGGSIDGLRKWALEMRAVKPYLFTKALEKVGVSHMVDAAPEVVRSVAVELKFLQSLKAGIGRHS